MIIKPGKLVKPISSTFETLDYENNTPSIENLPIILSANGINVATMARYKGQDANSTNWIPWKYGATLALQAGTAPSYNQDSFLMGPSDGGVLFNAGGYYTNNEATTGDVGAEDMALEFVGFIIPPVGFGQICTKRANNTATTPGYAFYSNGVAGFSFAFSNGVAAVTISSSTSPGVGLYRWVHAMLFINRDEASVNGSQWYINGIVSGAGKDVSVYAGSMSSPVNFTLGAYPAGATPFPGLISYIALWKQSNWFQAGASGPAEWATIAKERYSKMVGLYSTRGNSVPSSFTRGFGGHTEKKTRGQRKLFYISSDGIRPSSIVDTDNRLIKGALIEPSKVNYSHFSEFIGWSPVRSTIAATSVMIPDGRFLTTSMAHEDATGGNNHYYRNGPFSIGDFTKTHCLSCFLKKCNRFRAKLRFYEIGTTNYSECEFNLNTLTSTALFVSVPIVSCGVIPGYFNGWSRHYVSFTPTANSTWYAYLYLLDDAGNELFNGLNQDSIQIFGIQLEQGEYPSSYIPTPTNASVTRAADVLYYSATTNVKDGIGKIKSSIYVPNQDSLSNKYVLSIGKDGSRNNSIENYIDVTSDVPISECRKDGAIQYGITGSTDVASGKEKTIVHSWKSNKVTLEVSNTLEASSEGSYSIPTGLNRIYVGSDAAGANQLGGIIKNVKIYPKTDGER